MDKKLPYFSFYASDWLGSMSVGMMSLAEQGLYCRLLCIQWSLQDCGLPDDCDSLARLVGVNKLEFTQLSERVMKKFERYADGLLRNPKLYAEWLKVQKTYKKRCKGLEKARAARSLEREGNWPDNSSVNCNDNKAVNYPDNKSVERSVAGSGSGSGSNIKDPKEKVCVNHTPPPEPESKPKAKPKPKFDPELNEIAPGVYLTLDETERLAREWPKHCRENGLRYPVPFEDFLHDFSNRKAESKYRGRRQTDNRNMRNWGIGAFFQELARRQENARRLMRTLPGGGNTLSVADENALRAGLLTAEDFRQ